MSLIAYRHEMEYLGAYGRLIAQLYAAYPRVVEAKLREAQRAFSTRNPFAKHGTRRNFLLVVRNRVVAHVSACTDVRLPAGVGLVGHFESVNRDEYAHRVLGAARAHLATRRITSIRGPINMSTWHNFRVSYPETNPPYYLEPFTRSYYKRMFESYGFRAVYRGVSAIQAAGRTSLARYRSDFLRLRKEGFAFRLADRRTLRPALEDIHRLSSEIFEHTWTFFKITLEEFLYLFGEAYESTGGPLIAAAYHPGGQAVGFIVGDRDVYSRRVNRVVLKTMGVHPDCQGRGVGRALLYMAHRAAAAQGASQLIFSTMRTDNHSIFRLIGGKNPVYRRYEAYELAL